MSKAKRKPNPKRKQLDIVCRMSRANHKELMSYAEPKETFNEVTSRILRMFLHFKNAPLVYAADGMLYADISEARGAAIVSAVKRNEPPIMPSILAHIGNDEG